MATDPVRRPPIRRYVREQGPIDKAMHRNAARRATGFDAIGLLAFASAPSIALFQGVAETVGLPYRLDELNATLAPLAIIVVSLIARIFSGRSRLASPSIRRASLYLVSYLLVVLLATLAAQFNPIEREPAKMLQQLMATAAAIVVFFVMVSAPSTAAARRSLNMSMLVWAIAAVLTPLTAFTPFPVGEVQGVYEGSAGVRSFGVLGDGGTFVVSMLAVAFFTARRYVWFSLALIALIVSGSRSPLVVAAAALALVVILTVPVGAEARPGSRAIRVVIASLVSIVLLMGMQLLFSALSQRFGAINAFERLDQTDFTQSDRFFSISQGIEWAMRSPIFGNGFNAYYFFSFNSASFGANQSNALNQIVQTLVDGGVIALAFLVLFFIEALRPGQRMMADRLSDPYGMRIWLVAFLVLNQTAVFILPASSLTILVFAMCGIVMLGRDTVCVPGGRILVRRASVKGIPRAA